MRAWFRSGPRHECRPPGTGGGDANWRFSHRRSRRFPVPPGERSGFAELRLALFIIAAVAAVRVLFIATTPVELDFEEANMLVLGAAPGLGLLLEAAADRLVDRCDDLVSATVKAPCGSRAGYARGDGAGDGASGGGSAGGGSRPVGDRLCDDAGYLAVRNLDHHRRTAALLLGGGALLPDPPTMAAARRGPWPAGWPSAVDCSANTR